MDRKFFVCEICGTPHRDLLKRMDCEQSCYSEQLVKNKKEKEIIKNVESKRTEIKQIDDQIRDLNKQMIEFDKKICELYDARNKIITDCARDYGEFNFIVRDFDIADFFNNLKH